MARLTRLVLVMATITVLAVGCAGDSAGPEVVGLPVDENGFPTEWPIAVPPGTVSDCGNGQVLQEEVFFSVVVCLPDDPDPFTASEIYLAQLERDGFVEREPGAFITEQQTFLDGNGIEVYYQLVGDEATIVLIKPA